MGLKSTVEIKRFWNSFDLRFNKFNFVLFVFLNQEIR